MLFLKRDRYIGQSLDTYGEFSELEGEIFSQLLRPGDVVVEAGANIGAHTVPIAKLVGHQGMVFAFEPQRFIFQLLCANVALNELHQVRTFHGAVGPEAGTLKVPRLDYSTMQNFGGLSLEASGDGEEVQVWTVDALPLPSLRMLKVDVEGMETDVLMGARETIKKFRPCLYVENDRSAHSKKLITLIDELGYNMWWHLPRLFNPNNFAGEQNNIFGNVVSINLLCFAKEMKANVSGLRQVSGSSDSPWTSPLG
jgi:FkbM family methyltransferase